MAISHSLLVRVLMGAWLFALQLVQTNSAAVGIVSV